MNVTKTKFQTRVDMEWSELQPIVSQVPLINYLRTSNGESFYGGSFDFAEYSAFTLYKDAPKIPLIEIPELRIAGLDVDYNYDVTGEILDITSHIAGLPEQWLSPQLSYTHSSRVIDLSVEIGGKANITSASMTNRGQAIVALIESLELRGYSLSLTLVRSTVARGRDTSWSGASVSTGEQFVMTLPLKRIGEPLNINRTQFAIGHPSFYRRLLFGVQAYFGFDSSNTKTQDYVIPSDFHISHKMGLSEALQDALDWAETTAKTLQDKLEGKGQ